MLFCVSILNFFNFIIIFNIFLSHQITMHVHCRVLHLFYRNFDVFSALNRRHCGAWYLKGRRISSLVFSYKLWKEIEIKSERDDDGGSKTLAWMVPPPPSLSTCLTVSSVSPHSVPGHRLRGPQVTVGLVHVNNITVHCPLPTALPHTAIGQGFGNVKGTRTRVGWYNYVQ